MSTETYLDTDFRSLDYHRLIAQKIRNNPALLSVATNNIARWKHQNDFPQPYLDEWLAHIAQGLEHVLKFIVEESENAARLRSSSPFSGILTQRERLDILRTYYDETTT